MEQFIDSASIDMFGIGENLLIYLASNGERFVELSSAAQIVKKETAWLQKWANEQGISVSSIDPAGHEVQALTIDQFVEFLETEIENDNPYAFRLMSRASNHGVQNQIEIAKASGLDYIETPMGRVHITEHQGQTMMSVDDLASIIGVTPEQMEEVLNSPGFQAYLRHTQEFR